jgi:hypothetical protein
MRSCLTRDPSVVRGIRSQVTRYQAVRIGIRPFGTKGSQVRILSPRPFEALGVGGESRDSGGFAIFRDPCAGFRVRTSRRPSPGR